MKPPHTALRGDNRATWATAFEAAPLIKPPACGWCLTSESSVTRQEAGPAKACLDARMHEMRTRCRPRPAWSNRTISNTIVGHCTRQPELDRALSLQAASSYAYAPIQPTAFATLMRHDAPARTAVLSFNSAINACPLHLALDESYWLDWPTCDQAPFRPDATPPTVSTEQACSPQSEP